MSHDNQYNVLHHGVSRMEGGRQQRHGGREEGMEGYSTLSQLEARQVDDMKKRPVASDHHASESETTAVVQLYAQVDKTKRKKNKGWN